MAISIRENMINGLSDLWSRKIRSLVTIIGIILGTMSIIVVMSLMNGINKQTLRWMMERGGLSKITVSRNWSYNNPNNARTHFTWKEIQLIKSLIPEAVYFNPQIREWVRYSYRDKDYRSSIRGIMPDYAKIEEWDADQGRFISDLDVENSNSVIVIGTDLKEELFGSKDPIGELITVEGRRLQVIGVMKHRFMRNSGAMGNENALSYLNRRSFIPISTMIKKGTGEDEINSFAVKAESTEKALELADKLDNIILNLRKREPVFEVESAQERAQEMSKNQQMFQSIFFIISIISLLVGGIVIANIMLASIKERTREIGVRIAVGARRFDIFSQFLVQTVLVTIIGGILGIMVGLSLLDLVSNYLKIELLAGMNVIIIALFVSAGVGLLAGIIPAIMASKLNPVEALRYE